MTKIKPYLFGAFWIMLMVTTYFNLGEYYLFVVTAWYGLKWACKKSYKVRYKKAQSFILFVIYYFMVSVIGLFVDNVGMKNLIEFIMKYICLPFIIYEMLPNELEKQEKMLRCIKSLIMVSGIYGLCESLIKYNYLANVIQIASKDWMITMNLSQNYQPSSFFLHYNYYGCVLVLGVILGIYVSYRSKFLNIVYWGIILEQLLVCQSRICWISALVIAIAHIFKTKKITSTKAKRFLSILLACLCIYIFAPNIYISLIGMIDSRFSRLWVYGFQDGSLGQRIGTLLNFPAYFGENIIAGIFGTGYQSISVAFMGKYSYYKGYSTVDCQLTVYLVETGVIGVTILFAAIIRFLIRKNRINASDSIFCFSKFAFAAFLVECLTLDIVSNNVVLSLVLLPIVIAYKGEKIPDEVQNLLIEKENV